MKVLLFIFFISSSVFANNEACSRIALVNYQEILVDSSASRPGEGLRFYLEKDQTAKQLLDEYQDRSKPSWKSAAISTTGTLMILGGFLSSGNATGLGSRNTLLAGGASILILNYLYSRASQYKNESLLKRSVDEYNKRNLPKIYFSPYGDVDKSSLGVGIGITQEF